MAKDYTKVIVGDGNAKSTSPTTSWPRRVVLPDGSTAVVRSFDELKQLREAYSDYNK